MCWVYIWGSDRNINKTLENGKMEWMRDATESWKWVTETQKYFQKEMLRNEVLCVDVLWYINLKKFNLWLKTDNFSGCQNNPHELFDKVYLKTFFVGHKGTYHYFQDPGTSARWDSVSRNFTVVYMSSANPRCIVRTCLKRKHTDKAD